MALSEASGVLGLGAVLGQEGLGQAEGAREVRILQGSECEWDLFQKGLSLPQGP